jgi:hypothetical protein
MGLTEGFIAKKTRNPHPDSPMSLALKSELHTSINLVISVPKLTVCLGSFGRQGSHTCWHSSPYPS